MATCLVIIVPSFHETQTVFKFCLENIHDKPDNITIAQRSLMIKLNTHNRFYLKQVICVDVIRLHLQQLSANCM